MYVLILTALAGLLCLAQGSTVPPPPSSFPAVNAPAQTAAISGKGSAVAVAPTDTDALGRKIFIPVFRSKQKQKRNRVRVQ